MRLLTTSFMEDPEKSYFRRERQYDPILKKLS